MHGVLPALGTAGGFWSCVCPFPTITKLINSLLGMFILVYDTATYQE